MKQNVAFIKDFGKMNVSRVKTNANVTKRAFKTITLMSIRTISFGKSILMFSKIWGFVFPFINIKSCDYFQYSNFKTFISLIHEKGNNFWHWIPFFWKFVAKTEKNDILINHSPNYFDNQNVRRKIQNTWENEKSKFWC